MIGIPIGAVNAAQVHLRDGEDTLADFRRQDEDWVAANQSTSDGWIVEAVAAAR